MNGKGFDNTRVCKLLTICCAIVLLVMAAPPTTSAWAPSKPIEFVVQAGPGGGSDVLARTIASLVEAEKLCPVPIVVVNKPGGGSVVGTTYVAQQKNPTVIATYHSGNLVAPITAGVEIAQAKNLTMLVNLAVDEQLLVVRSDSPFKSVKDMVAAAKKAPSKPFNVGGTTPAQDDEICNALLERAAGIKLRYVSFNSGGETITALLGGHVDMIWANPSEFAPQAEAKQVRPLAVAKEERLPFMKDVTTFKEQGYNVTWKMFRGIAAPPRIGADAIAFYETMFKKMSDSARWKEGYIDKYMLTPMWMGHEQFSKFVPQEEQLAVGVLKELGLVK